ncbi:MAG: hypothetical protein ACLUTA_05185 [Blautia wexlerae]
MAKESAAIMAAFLIGTAFRLKYQEDKKSSGRSFITSSTTGAISAVAAIVSAA